MADHIMTAQPIPGMLSTLDGYEVCMITQATAAAVADDDTLTFPNTTDVLPVGIKGDDTDIVDFDTSGDSSGSHVVTVNATVLTTGIAGTSISGLALVKRQEEIIK